MSTSISRQDYYSEKALEYAEKYGIITYKVKGNKMIYNVNFNQKEFKGKWVMNHHTMQRTVNLDTMEVTSKMLQKLQKNGWDNI